MKEKTKRRPVVKATTASKKLKESDIEFYLVQGKAFMFFSVLNGSDDYKLIYSLYSDLMIDLTSLRLTGSRTAEILIFPFIKNYSEMYLVEVSQLANKLVWVLTENDVDELEISWFRDQLVL